MKKRTLGLLLALLLLLTVPACQKSGQTLTYEVHFELNGGSLVSGSLLQRVPEGGDAEPPVAERSGYVFSGWSPEPANVQKNLSVIAQWTPAETEAPVYEVHFELNGGSLVSGSLLQRIPAGGSAEAPQAERSGYILSGWSPDFTDVREDLSVVAQWTPGETQAPVYEVRFELNGGSLVSGEVLQRIPAGGSAEAPEVERGGYDFAGWNVDLSQIHENTVAVAQWARLYEIRFDLAGGTAEGELIQHLRAGQTPVVPEPVKENAVFLGWSAEPGTVTGNMVYYARWEEHYTVTFDPGAGSLVSGEAVQELIAGQTPAAPEVALSGAEFDGWSPTVGPVSADTVYVAQWRFPEPEGPLSAEQVFQRITPSVVTVVVSDRLGEPFALGSGFFISDQGVLVTNRHVVEGAYSAVAYLQDETVIRITKVLAQSPDIDLVVLQADITGNPYLETETSVATGETVYALGSPHGLTETFTSGIVSNALRYEDRVAHIQFTAPISSGNSGGPLVDNRGRVIGVNTWTRTDSQNINYAVKITELDNLDWDRSMTMYAFGRETDDHQTAVSEQSGGYYDELTTAETEPNDSAVLANELPYDELLAADLKDYYDMDLFHFTVTEAGKYGLFLFAFDDAQLDVYDLYLVYAEGEEGQLIGEARRIETDKTVSSVILEELAAGDYFVIVTAAEEWKDGAYPLYYALAWWQPEE